MVTCEELQRELFQLDFHLLFSQFNLDSNFIFMAFMCFLYDKGGGGGEIHPVYTCNHAHWRYHLKVCPHTFGHMVMILLFT